MLFPIYWQMGQSCSKQGELDALRQENEDLRAKLKNANKESPSPVDVDSKAIDACDEVEVKEEKGSADGCGDEYKWPPDTVFTPAPNAHFLVPGESLQQTDYIHSPNEKWHGRFQPNGNFCIFEGAVTPDKDLRDASWWTGTFVKNGSFHLSMMEDGFTIINTLSNDTEVPIRTITNEEHKSDQMRLTDKGTLELIQFTSEEDHKKSDGDMKLSPLSSEEQILWSSADNPTNILRGGLSLAMNENQFLTSLNQEFFMVLLANGHVLIQGKEPTATDTHDSAVWGSQLAKASDGEDRGPFRMYVSAKSNLPDQVYKGNFYVIGPSDNLVRRVSNFAYNTLSFPWSLALYNTGELVLSGLQQGVESAARWNRPFHRTVELRHSQYWFENGCYLVPEISDGEYTKVYLTVNNEGDVLFCKTLTGDILANFKNTKLKGGPPFRLINGTTGEGTRGRLYIEDSTFDSVEVHDFGAVGKDTNVYVLKVEQSGVDANRMVMWDETDGTVLWTYPSP